MSSRKQVTLRPCALKPSHQKIYDFLMVQGGAEVKSSTQTHPMPSAKSKTIIP